MVVVAVFGCSIIQPASILLLPVQPGKSYQSSHRNLTSRFVCYFHYRLRKLTIYSFDCTDEVTSVTFANGTFLRSMSDTVEKYMDQCGRRWVDLGSIFSFMKL